MARDPEPGLTPTIYRSGAAGDPDALYIVRRGDAGRVVRPGGRAYPAVLFGALLSHLHVVDPWEPVEWSADLPAAVRQVARDPAGWTLPDE